MPPKNNPLTLLSSRTCFNSISTLHRHSRSQYAYLSQSPVRVLGVSPPKSDSLAIHEQVPTVGAVKLGASVARPATPLACLPLSQVIRTYLISAVSSSPPLLSASTKLLQAMLESRYWITDVERNPVLSMLLRETFYKQFCAGNDKPQVQSCVANLERAGYDGVILEYAREVLDDKGASDELTDVRAWQTGILSCIDMAKSGDCVGLKWSGMGGTALQLMKAEKPPSPAMAEAMQLVCKTASAKGVKLLPAAEETNTLAAFHDWSIGLQRQFNKNRPTAIVHTTYQAYLRCSADYVAKHMADAKQHGYTLGAKIVRGAYLGSEPSSKVWESKERTDQEYDGLAAAVLRSQYNDTLKPVDGQVDQSFPTISLVIATHNADSVRNAQLIRNEQTRLNQPKIELSYAQLQGMADEVSYELIRTAKDAARSTGIDAPRVYKLTTWGTMTECLTYLLRRANENKEAAGRTRESKLAMRAELGRRLKALFGFA